MFKKDDRPLAEVRRTILAEHLNVGPTKPVSYLPIETIEGLLGLTLEEYRASFRNPEIRVVVFATDECCIYSGAVYAYDHQPLGALLKELEDVLRANGWPIVSDAFIKRIAAEWVEIDSPIMPTIRQAFGDS